MGEAFGALEQVIELYEAVTAVLPSKWGEQARTELVNARKLLEAAGNYRSGVAEGLPRRGR